MAQKPKQSSERDSAFILKLLLYMALGSLWLKIHSTDLETGIPIPVGFIVGLVFASHDHFQIDRKVEYAVLVVAALIGLVLPYGIFIG